MDPTTLCVQQTLWVMVPQGPDPCSIGSLVVCLGRQEGSLDCFPWYYLAASFHHPPTWFVWSFRISFSHRRLVQSLEIFRQFYTTSLMSPLTQCKVHIILEGHKILRNLHLIFDYSTYSQKKGEDFAKFCGLLRIYELYKKKCWKTFKFMYRIFIMLFQKRIEIIVSACLDATGGKSPWRASD